MEPVCGIIAQSPLFEEAAESGGFFIAGKYASIIRFNSCLLLLHRCSVGADAQT